MGPNWLASIRLKAVSQALPCGMGAPGTGSILTADPPEQQKRNVEFEHEQEREEIDALRELQAKGGNPLD